MNIIYKGKHQIWMFGTFAIVIFSELLEAKKHGKFVVSFVYKFPESQIGWCNSLARNEFPENFLFGVETSGNQVEDTPNLNDKGNSMNLWDRVTRTNKSSILNGTNADADVDSYHKYKEDIQLAKRIGSKMYRISISWPRILPNGIANSVNEDGIKYYNDLINETIKNGMEPMVALFNWDLPRTLPKLDGWIDSKMPEYFVSLARIAFQAFGDRVKYWITVNEPSLFCNFYYGGPDEVTKLNKSGIADYSSVYNCLLSHIATYNMYREEFQKSQKGKVGLGQSFPLFVAKDESYQDDDQAIKRANEWIISPIFIATVNHPEIISSSGIRNLRRFTDFLVMNLYSPKPIIFYNDTRTISIANAISQEQIMKSTPWPLGEALKPFCNEYICPDIFIAENEYADAGDLIDVNRTIYFHHHLQEVLKTLQKGIPIRGYFLSSLTDCFEPRFGFSVECGIFQVDFEHNQTRIPKLSSRFLSDVYKTRTIPNIENFLNTSVTEETIRMMYL